MSRHEDTSLPSIGQAELEILSYIQSRHPVTVRDVADHLADKRGIVRTTVLNVMTRLCRKGYLRRKRIDGVYHYSPQMARGQVLKSLVKDFVDRSLGGSVSPFVAFLMEDARLSDDELTQLRKAVQELDERSKG
jgi:predicted transcriptional regulator